MRNRKNQTQRKRREERLDTRNGAGYFDFTAFKAIANIKHEAKLPMKQTFKELSPRRSEGSF